MRLLPFMRAKNGFQFAGGGMDSDGGGGGGSYTLPIASDTTLGGVKVGDRLSINSSTGVLSASDQSTPIATTETAGKVKPDGTSVTITSDGTITAVGGGSYTLPIASDTTLGGVKVGTGLAIDSTSGVLSATGGGSYTLPIASDTTLGGVKVGDRLSIDSTTGVLTASDQSTPIATTSVAGKVIPDGTTITVDLSGTISSVDQTPIATTSVAGKVKPDGTSITVDANGVISADIGTATPLGTSVDLSTYTSGSTYTTTVDGYVSIYCFTTGDYCRLGLYGSQVGFDAGYYGTSMQNLVYVKKGCTITVLNLTGTAEPKFYPFT